MNVTKAIAGTCIAAFFSLSIIGCGPKPSNSGFESTIPAEMQKRIDKKWSEGIWAVGSATGPNENMAVKKAAADARTEIARQFKSQIEALEKGYEEAVNDKAVEEYSQVKEIFTSMELTGSKQDLVLARQDKDGWTAKVLVVVSAEQFKAALDEKLNAYTSFKAQKAYKELEQRVEKERQMAEQD